MIDDIDGPLIPEGGFNFKNEDERQKAIHDFRYKLTRKITRAFQPYIEEVIDVTFGKHRDPNDPLNKYGGLAAILEMERRQKEERQKFVDKHEAQNPGTPAPFGYGPNIRGGNNPEPRLAPSVDLAAIAGTCHFMPTGEYVDDVLPLWIPQCDENLLSGEPCKISMPSECPFCHKQPYVNPEHRL